MKPTPDEPTPNPASPDDPELIAYLDGELGAEDSRTIESRIALDAAIRARAEEYKKTYELLDYLPKPEPSPTFATRTMTKLQPVLAKPPASSLTTPSLASSGSTPLSSRHRLWPELFLWIGAAVVLGGVGYFGHLLARPYLNPAKETAAIDQDDLPLIHALPLYLGVDDLQFLQRLRESGTFEDDGSSAAPAAFESETISLAHQQKLIALFQSFPTTRQEQLRMLHHQLAELPAKDRAPLHRSLENYAVWLDRLPEPYRTEILGAPNGADRLETVLRVRERLWRESLPPAQRQAIKTLVNIEERTQYLRELKQREQTFRKEWELTRQQWQPNKSDDQKAWPFNKPELAKPLDEYIRKAFGVDLGAPYDKKTEIAAPCRLNREELNELRLRHDAAVKEGYWYSYGACLLQLSEQHPMLPEPGKGKPITQLDQPPLAQAKIRNLVPKDGTPLWQRLKTVSGRWPDFALEIHRLDAASKDRLPPLGPCKPGEFHEDVEHFLSEQLFKKLTVAEKNRLDSLQGKWPEYPRQMIELAKAKNLSVPGAMLPGEPKLWNETFRISGSKK